MNLKYIPSQFESKWIEKWKKEKINEFVRNPKKNKYYVLVELPYTSGDLHIGHWFAFTVPDVLARFKKMSGFNVLYPNGYDAFGLPAENAAIKRNIHPRDWTMKNIKNMTAQYGTMGTMIDWNYTAITCEPEFYRWNQWIFLKLYEKDLIYRGKILSNWCEKDQTVLANENVEAGKCWRCGTKVIQKEVDQWFIKITKYADKLIWPNNPSVDWPQSVRTGQNNWIGKTEGIKIKFVIRNPRFDRKARRAQSVIENIEVFTTRPETIDGATFLVLAPEHPFIKKIQNSKIKNQNIDKYVKKTQAKSDLQRTDLNKEKTGVFTGFYAINPYTKKEIPIWVADYVLMSYGTGAIMAVPSADKRDKEFAEKFNLPIIKTTCKSAPVGKKTNTYHIHDWSISRQRYWGTPVPMIHCEKCGIVPVPEKDLPVELPYEVDFTPHGKPPLASNEAWLNVPCPKCGGQAKRDAETLDTFFDSSWYFYRYLSPHYQKGPFDEKIIKDLMPVDIYFGGAEHTLGHTLYARFFTKFFKDICLVDFDEFALKRFQHGVILGPDGNRMSKSRGNVINPDEVVKEYGADTVRLYLCFIMPYESTGPWSTTTIMGVHRFLKRIWNLYQNFVNITDISSSPKRQPHINYLQIKLYKTIKKVSSDIKNIKPNTAIAAMMEFVNEWEKCQILSVQHAKKFLQILAPFAPFMTEEIWRTVFGEKTSIHLSSWPVVDESEISTDEEISIPVQVNGKVRIVLTTKKSEASEKNVVKKALQNEKIKKYTDGKKYKVIYIKEKILNIVV
jgi:leucyl-tRNA synthetase